MQPHGRSVPKKSSQAISATPASSSAPITHNSTSSLPQQTHTQHKICYFYLYSSLLHNSHSNQLSCLEEMKAVFGDVVLKAVIAL
ncbi:hypothetical protein QOT17_014629 [Balamuthia mandrillaris]